LHAHGLVSKSITGTGVGVVLVLPLFLPSSLVLGLGCAAGMGRLLVVVKLEIALTPQDSWDVL